MTGGFIRAIALTAAWLAAESGEVLGMAHLERAARQGIHKLGKPLSEAELRGSDERDHHPSHRNAFPGADRGRGGPMPRSFEAELTALLERHGLPRHPPADLERIDLARCRWPLATSGKAWAAIWPRH